MNLLLYWQLCSLALINKLNSEFVFIHLLTSTVFVFVWDNSNQAEGRFLCLWMTGIGEQWKVQRQQWPWKPAFQNTFPIAANGLNKSNDQLIKCTCLEMVPLEIHITKAKCLGACGSDVIHLKCIVDDWSATNQRRVSRQWYSHAHNQQVQPA